MTTKLLVLLGAMCRWAQRGQVWCWLTQPALPPRPEWQPGPVGLQWAARGSNLAVIGSDRLQCTVQRSSI